MHCDDMVIIMKTLLIFFLIIMAMADLPQAQAQSVGGTCSGVTSAGPDSNGNDLVCSSGTWALADMQAVASNTTAMTVHSNGYISLTTGGTTTGYMGSSGLLVLPGVSVTTASATAGAVGF